MTREHHRVARPRLAAIALLLAATTLGACERTPPWRGVTVDPPQPTPAFTFTRADGSPFSTAPERGRPLLVFFGYTHCPDVCPLTLAEWARAKRQLGAAGDRVRWLFVTVDPARDSAPVVERYARQFDPSFVGVSGDSATTAMIQQAFGVTSWQDHVADSAALAGGYLVTHASQVFLVDDAGRIRAMYPFDGGVDAIVADLQRLLD